MTVVIVDVVKADVVVTVTQLLPLLYIVLVDVI